MSLITEKKEAIKMVEQLDDIATVRLIKKILSVKQEKSLEQSIDKGLNESIKNNVISHEDVMLSFKKKYFG